MLKCFKEELDKGWTPNKTNKNTTLHNAITSFEPNKRLTEKYLTELKRTTNQLIQFFPPDAHLRNIDHTHLTNYLTKTTNTASCFNHERARISSVLGAAYNEAKLPNPCLHIKPKKVKPALHKPFKDVSIVLEDIKSFNEKLFLCCLLTYGCLLRPHQEIRNLKWGDFSEDMKHISLSGRRNKSGRNRIVPLNPYILQYLDRKEDSFNIFTNDVEAVFFSV